MKEAIIGVLIGLVLAFAFSALVAWIIMLLWNSVVCTIFNAPELNFWLSFGLMLLVSLLFWGGG